MAKGCLMLPLLVSSVSASLPSFCTILVQKFLGVWYSESATEVQCAVLASALILVFVIFNFLDQCLALSSFSASFDKHRDSAYAQRSHEESTLSPSQSFPSC